MCADVSMILSLSDSLLARLFATHDLRDDLLVFPDFIIFFHAIWEPESKKNADPNFENWSNKSGGPRKFKKFPNNEICGVLTKIYS